MATNTAPPAGVLAAFGVAGASPMPLPGGQGGTWRADGLILKPVDYLPETLWRADALDSLRGPDGFRVARPVRTQAGGWVAGGWEATRLVAGATDVSRPDDAIRAGIAFHAAVADLPRPAFLDERDNPWSYGDRVAWDELPDRAGPAAARLLRPLIEARGPVALAPQAVHGDLAGNVLFADGLPPAVIDWPVYWRPPAWAYAVAVADALCWYGASPGLARRWEHLPCWGQMLVRALIYRIATDEAAHPATAGDGGRGPEHYAAYRPAVSLALRYARY
ncbi:MAG: TIGR02569 family protein [Trebonia sp.]